MLTRLEVKVKLTVSLDELILRSIPPVCSSALFLTFYNQHISFIPRKMLLLKRNLEQVLTDMGKKKKTPWFYWQWQRTVLFASNSPVGRSGHKPTP